MVKLPFYSSLLAVYFNKFLLPLGYVNSDYNASVEFREAFRHQVRFVIGIVVSGVTVHAAGFAFYFFLKVSLPLWVHAPLVVSYGLFFFVVKKFVDMFRNKTIEVGTIG